MNNRSWTQETTRPQGSIGAADGGNHDVFVELVETFDVTLESAQSAGSN